MGRADQCRVVPFGRRGVVRRGAACERCFPVDGTRRVSLAGTERVLFSSAGTALAILDVFRDGRALIATHVARMGCSCLAPGQTQPRELSWLDGSAPEALSADGQTVLLSELLSGAGKNGSTYVRKTDGSDAIRLGEGYGEDLSPDGKWVLTTEVPDAAALDIAAYRCRDHPGRCPTGPLVGRNEANFLPDGRQIVFGGSEKERGTRIYLQDIDSGSIRPISPEGRRDDCTCYAGRPVCDRLNGGAAVQVCDRRKRTDTVALSESRRQTRAVEPGWLCPLRLANGRVAAGSRSCGHGDRRTPAVEDDSAGRSGGRRQHHQNSVTPDGRCVLPRLRAVSCQSCSSSKD